MTSTSPNLKAVPADNAVDVLAEIRTLIEDAPDDVLTQAHRQIVVAQTKRHLAAISRLIESPKANPDGLGYVHDHLADIRRQLEAPPAKPTGSPQGFNSHGEPIPF
jgi:hypothetical protein